MTNTFEIAERLKGLRDDMSVSAEEMAEIAGITTQQYLDYEAGKTDFSVMTLLKWAERFGVDVTELMTGRSPKLSTCSLVKSGKGVNVERRSNLSYQHLAATFKNRLIEPYKVVAPYSDEEQTKPIELSTHEGQEMDYVLSGRLLVTVNGKTEILDEGDTIYYDSSNPHGMIAVDGKDAVFLAIVMK